MGQLQARVKVQSFAVRNPVSCEKMPLGIALAKSSITLTIPIPLEYLDHSDLVIMRMGRGTRIRPGAALPGLGSGSGAK